MARPKGDQAATALRRQAILDAALEVFGANGFRGGSLRLVAESVGMTEAGILHHFGSKVNLLIQVLQNRDDKSNPYLDVEHQTGPELVAGWLRLIRFNVEHRGTVELYTVISAEATSSDHPAHEFFQSRYKMVVETLARMFARLESEGNLASKQTVDELSRRLIALSDGLQIQWLLDDNLEMNYHHELFFQNALTAKAWSEVELILVDSKAA
jgi:AcrR family transcriptional regulator